MTIRFFDPILKSIMPSQFEVSHFHHVTLTEDKLLAQFDGQELCLATIDHGDYVSYIVSEMTVEAFHVRTSTTGDWIYRSFTITK